MSKEHSKELMRKLYAFQTFFNIVIDHLTGATNSDKDNLIT